MSSPCILIVEDDANLCKTLHDILALKGYAPMSAASGQAALAAAQNQPSAGRRWGWRANARGRWAKWAIAR